MAIKKRKSKKSKAAFPELPRHIPSGRVSWPPRPAVVRVHHTTRSVRRGTIRRKTKVSTSYTAEAAFLATIGGAVTACVFGPVAGIAAGIGSFAAGYPVIRKQAREEAEQVLPDKNHAPRIAKAIREGKRKVVITSEVHDIHPTVPPLGRLVFGDRLAKKTTYFLD